MSGEPSRAPVRFCPGCGSPVADAANFCTTCGAALRDSPAEASPRRVSEAPSAVPGVAVLAAFLAVGLALWFVILRPEEERSRRPLAPKASPAGAASAPSGAPVGADDTALPTDHPPLRIPEEVRVFIEDLETKAEAAPDDLPVWRQLAQVQFRAGQIDATYLDRSEASWRHVLELAPDDPEALRGLGNLHFDRDEYAEAIERYQAYLEKRPDDINVRTDLGTMLLYSGKPEEAIREYDTVIAADAKFFQAHFNLGVAHARMGEAEKAQAAFEKARDTAPDDETRTRIQSMIERSTPGEAAGGFQGRVERNVRSHPIAGPKIVRLEWTSPAEGRLLLEEFPMEAMPPFARTKFLERLETELAEARRAEGVEAPARLELVDAASGAVMATVEAK